MKAGIVRDSSIWENNDSYDAIRRKDLSLRIGIVRDYSVDPDTQEISYIVEMFDKNNQIPIYCKRMERFGGAFNYEEWTRQTYVVDKNSASASKYSCRAGDVVIVALMRGDSREGIIIGGVAHPGRTQHIDLSSGIAYQSEFNGLNTSIDDEGEYTVTFKGLPTNIDKLNEPSDGNDIPAPTYDTSVGGSYYKFDQMGSWTLSDAAQSNPQSIYVNKPAGTITVSSGAVTITMDKNAQSVTVQNKDTTINSSNSIIGNTANFAMTASATAKVKSPKIAIGTDGTELLDQITKLITAIGDLTAISPVGPCAPLISAPQWSEVQQIFQAINNIKGTL